MERNSTDAIIEDKMYTISTDQDASYVRQLAEYINEKMELLHRQSEYSKQPNAVRQMLVLMHMADDYCRMKKQADEATQKYEKQEAEFYNMKREMVNMQLAMANMKKQLQEKEQSHAVCPYLQSLEKQSLEACEAHKESVTEKTGEPESEPVSAKKPRPPYETFAHGTATHKKK